MKKPYCPVLKALIALEGVSLADHDLENGAHRSFREHIHKEYTPEELQIAWEAGPAQFAGLVTRAFRSYREDVRLSQQIRKAGEYVETLLEANGEDPLTPYAIRLLGRLHNDVMAALAIGGQFESIWRTGGVRGLKPYARQVAHDMIYSQSVFNDLRPYCAILHDGIDLSATPSCLLAQRIKARNARARATGRPAEKPAKGPPWQRSVQKFFIAGRQVTMPGPVIE